MGSGYCRSTCLVHTCTPGEMWTQGEYRRLSGHARDPPRGRICRMSRPHPGPPTLLRSECHSSSRFSTSSPGTGAWVARVAEEGYVPVPRLRGCPYDGHRARRVDPMVDMARLQLEHALHSTPRALVRSCIYGTPTPNRGVAASAEPGRGAQPVDCSADGWEEGEPPVSRTSGRGAHAVWSPHEPLSASRIHGRAPRTLRPRDR